MKTEHFEILVEEPSAEAFLTEILPRLLGNRATFTIHAHQGKRDLLDKLAGRLRGYAKWLPAYARILVLIDRDNDDCKALKQQLDQISTSAGLLTRNTSGELGWQLVNRLAIEELEAWYFGEWTGVQKAYPRVPTTVPNRAAYREPDNILGGTWEALERILKRGGYFSGGLRKMEAAVAIGKHLELALSKSPSFNKFRDALLDAVS